MISWFIDFNKKSTALGHILMASDLIEKSHGRLPFEMKTHTRVKIIRDAVNQIYPIVKKTHKIIGIEEPSWICVAAHASIVLCKKNPPRGLSHAIDLLLVSEIIRHDFRVLDGSIASLFFIMKQYEELLEEYPVPDFL